MSSIRAPDKETIKTAYETGKYTFKKLSDEFGISTGTIKSWAKRDKDNGQPWIKNKAKKVATKSKKVATKNKVKNIKNEESRFEEVEEIMNSELTDKQRLFCHYYLKSFNATMAAKKAGYALESAHVEGSRLLRNAKVRKEIKKLKGKMTEELFIDAMDVLRKYVEIAFADITDYVEYGKKEIVVDKDEDGNEVKALVNYVDFKDSCMVDGTIIEEVSQGKNGVKIKLHDKMKALEKLEKYFDLFPDKFKRKIEEEKHKMAKYKFEIEKSKLKTPDQPKHNKVTENELKAILEDDEDYD